MTVLLTNMRPTIDEVNSLLKLGAVFVPPVGAVVCTMDWDYDSPNRPDLPLKRLYWIVCHCTRYGAIGYMEWWVRVKRCMVLEGHITQHNNSITPTQIESYVRLPEDCSSLEQWRRLDRSVV